MENNVLKIIEWNIEKRNNKKDIDNIVDNIVDKIYEQKADVIVLTEATSTNSGPIIEKLNEITGNKFFACAISNGGNFNNIVIAISSDKIACAGFEDFYTYNKPKKAIYCEENNHPDRLLVRLKLKNGRNITILGIRMGIGGSKRDQIEQVIALEWEIENSEPDIIIGDFNWSTAIQNRYLHSNLNEEKFESVFINGLKPNEGEGNSEYNMWPAYDNDLKKRKSNEKEISHIGSKSYTGPDRVIWKEESLHLEHRYLHGKKQKKDETINLKEFEENWPSDHDILIVKVSLDENAPK